MSEEVIAIDGSTMEGGGQILRMSMAFSALLKKPVRIYNIRAGRSKPGLRPQHLSGLYLVRDFTNGRLIGAEEGSTDITFYPGAIKSGKYFADPGTAGSIMLLFQISFPCLLFADGPTELNFKGGTNADMAPQIDHTLMVFKPVVERLGAKFNCTILRRGYFPKGGGEVVIHVNPVSTCLEPIELLDPGEVADVQGRSFVAGVLPIKMAHEMADSAANCLKAAFPGIPTKIERIKEPSHMAVGNGSGIVLVAKTTTGCLIGGGSLGKRGISTSVVGEEAAKELIEDCKSKACVDRYVEDQLIIFMALAKGKSKLKIGQQTLHAETAIYIAQLLTEAKFSITRDEGQSSCILECEGIGLQR